MASLIKNIKQYIQFKHLQANARTVIADSKTLKNFLEQISSEYSNGKDLKKYEQDLNSIQTIQSTSPIIQDGVTPDYNFNDNSSIQEQYQYTKTYADLVRDGKDVFSTYHEYLNWKDKLTTAYENNQSFDDYSYSLDMFESLQNAKTSPIYQEQVNNLAKDTHQFSAFTSIAEDVSEDYITPSFSGTDEFNNALDATTTNGQTISMFETSQEEVDKNVVMPQTNRTVLYTFEGGLDNPEALFDENGLRAPSQFTTKGQQDAKEIMFNELIGKCTSQEEVDEIVESFTPDALPESDIESNLIDDGETGAFKNEELSQLQSNLGGFDTSFMIDTAQFSISNDNTLDIKRLRHFAQPAFNEQNTSTETTQSSSADMDLEMT